MCISMRYIVNYSVLLFLFSIEFLTNQHFKLYLSRRTTVCFRNFSVSSCEVLFLCLSHSQAPHLWWNEATLLVSVELKAEVCLRHSFLFLGTCKTYTCQVLYWFVYSSWNDLGTYGLQFSLFLQMFSFFVDRDRGAREREHIRNRSWWCVTITAQWSPVVSMEKIILVLSSTFIPWDPLFLLHIRFFIDVLWT